MLQNAGALRLCGVLSFPCSVRSRLACNHFEQFWCGDRGRAASWHGHPCFSTLAFYDCVAGREAAGAGAAASLVNQEEADLAAMLFSGELVHIPFICWTTFLVGFSYRSYRLHLIHLI